MASARPKHRRRNNADDHRKTRRVIATLLFPWLTARFLFRPRVGPSRKDRTLDRLAFWRSTVGLGVILVATSQYQDVSANLIEKALETGRLA